VEVGLSVGSGTTLLSLFLDILSISVVISVEVKEELGAKVGSGTVFLVLETSGEMVLWSTSFGSKLVVSTVLHCLMCDTCLDDGCS